MACTRGECRDDQSVQKIIMPGKRDALAPSPARPLYSSLRRHERNASEGKASMTTNPAKISRGLILALLGATAGLAVGQLPVPAEKDAVRAVQAKYQQE